jgi:hypothetical protein
VVLMVYSRFGGPSRGVGESLAPWFDADKTTNAYSTYS